MTPKNPRLNPVRVCPECDQEFQSRGESRSYAQRFCSRECGWANRTRRKRATWPSEQEMRRMVYEDKLSDSKIGELFGHSYEWARQVRNAYRIAALPKPPHREVKHDRYSGRTAFSAKAKREGRCRNCGKVPTGVGPLGAIHAHHAIPRSTWKAGKADPRNCIPLCFDCHQGWHDHRVRVWRHAFTPDEWAFLRTAEIGQNIDYWLDINYPYEDAPLPLGDGYDEQEGDAA